MRKEGIEIFSVGFQLKEAERQGRDEELRRQGRLLDPKHYYETSIGRTN